MQVIQEIGAYAGFASVVGLAVLSALYFSQARDLKRLREWAGRMPDRPPAPPHSAAESRGPVQTPQASAAAAPSGDPGRAQPTAAPLSRPDLPAGRGSATAVSEAAPSQARGAATALQIDSPSGQRTHPPGVARAPSPRSVPTRTQGAGASARPAPSAERRPERSWDLRYVAIAVVGVLIVIGGVTFAVGLVGGREEQGAQEQASEATQPTQPRDAAGAPGSVTFSVLNGTGVDGLAKQVADELEAAGYLRGNVTNASAQKAESAVLYAQGARGDALAVARELEVSQTEPIDPASRSLAGDASVVVVVGADQTQ